MNDGPDSRATGPSIRVMPNGPYLVRGLPLARRRQVASEHGEPMTWQTVERLETRDVYTLCRCGGSSTKPFCDGTHARAGFDGTETAETTTYDERATTLGGTGITVRDDRSLCEHAGFCGNRATNVWRLVAGSATEDSVTRGQVMAMVERCPSGALSYRLPDERDDLEPELPLQVGVVDDGPYFVTGGVTVERSDGLPVERRNRMTLCRCGNSANKPFCDGTHRNVGFRDRSSRDRTR